jgi:4-amino-4-deoxy-L-arabinose transferase-like glycosyltransferase
MAIPRSTLNVEAASRLRASSWVVVLSLTLILGTFAARCLHAALAYSPTWDEYFYLGHSLQFWRTGHDQDMWRRGVPPLPHVINASLPYLVLRQVGLLPAASADLREAFPQLIRGDNPRSVILLARCVAIGYGLVLLLAVYWAVARSRGAAQGLVAATLLSIVPEVLAHASVATSDMPCAAAMFVALVILARYAERPSLRRWVATALAVGLAWATRHTGMLLLPLAIGVHACSALRQPGPLGVLPIGRCLAGTARASIILLTLAFLVLWAGDGFSTVQLSSDANPSPRLRSIDHLGPFDVAGLPIPTSLLSAKFQVVHAAGGGHPAYFCGEYSDRGWPFYFPVAFLLKSPIGLLVLMAVASPRVRPRDSWDWILLACLALLWITLVRSRTNIGLRYALLTYPLIMPFIARLSEPRMIRDWIWGPITIAAALSLAWTSVVCHPRYLSFFNQLGGGPSRGWLYLADSNIDWGQDRDALAAALQRLGIEEITIAVGGDGQELIRSGIRICNLDYRSQEDLIPTITLPKRRLYYADGRYRLVSTRYVALSVNSLLGLRMFGNWTAGRDSLHWLWTRRLVERVNDSIFIFDLGRPAERTPES